MYIRDPKIYVCEQGHFVLGRGEAGRDMYLHSDGEWRNSTAHPTDHSPTAISTGYFSTRGDAEAALRNFQGTSSTSMGDALTRALKRS